MFHLQNNVKMRLAQHQTCPVSYWTDAGLPQHLLVQSLCHQRNYQKHNSYLKLEIDVQESHAIVKYDHHGKKYQMKQESLS